MTLSMLIKEKRDELGMTLEEFGEQVNVTKATVQRWESGNIKMLKWSTAVKLAKVLGMNPYDFEELEENDKYRLSKEEMKLIDAYRDLNQDGKRNLSEYIEFLTLRYGKKDTDIQKEIAQ